MYLPNIFSTVTNFRLQSPSPSSFDVLGTSSAAEVSFIRGFSHTYRLPQCHIFYACLISPSVVSKLEPEEPCLSS
ncbi:hypothetical protein Hypma_004268 [Hypsizygus marmoreus]|uniref:Uncharacterized protein n=1 Tax=Hypsizygus marmoreus TaxID=39966 RepID=A0A369J2B4_HYPMA|nr:hypothetical protein Hypma_004268 [Hypsizygus marmoreus]